MQERYDFRWRRGHTAVLAVICVIVGIALTVKADRCRRHATALLPLWPSRIRLARLRIDPNTASAASLRRLRKIGRVKADAIIAFRRMNAPRVFRRPSDLQQVNGIGPAIVARIAPELSFPPANPLSDGSE